MAQATESDNYTERDLILKKANAAPVVEKMINKLIADSITEANTSNIDIHMAVRKRLATDSFGIMGAIAQSLSPFKMYGIPVTPLEWVLDQQNIAHNQSQRSSGVFDIVAQPVIRNTQKEKWGDEFIPLLNTQFPLEKSGHRVRLEKSIFKNLNLLQSGLSGMPGTMFVASLNINGSAVGIDKLGHFFAQGYSYYESLQQGRSLEQILIDGKFEEETALGKGVLGISAFGSGVVSYGDLAANYYGLQFWKQLTAGKKPFITEKKGKLVQVRKFKFSDYPVYAFDEAINISSYHGLATKGVHKAIADLGYSWDKPVDAKQESSLIALGCASYYTSKTLGSKSKCEDEYVK